QGKWLQGSAPCPDPSSRRSDKPSSCPCPGRTRWTVPRSGLRQQRPGQRHRGPKPGQGLPCSSPSVHPILSCTICQDSTCRGVFEVVNCPLKHFDRIPAVAKEIVVAARTEKAPDAVLATLLPGAVGVVVVHGQVLGLPRGPLADVATTALSP